MAKLLYIKASPRKERSHSVAVADAFVETYLENHASDEIIKLNLFEKDLIPFDGLAVQAKYTILHGQKHSDAELNAWKNVEKTIAEFKSADKYLFAVPMWNFGIPYRLKQYLDIIIQPGYTFSFSPSDGYKGLLTGKKAFVAYARGGEYGPDSDFDFQKKYFQLALGFMGITDVKDVLIEPTLQGGPDTAKAKQKEAVDKAKAVACCF